MIEDDDSVSQTIKEETMAQQMAEYDEEASMMLQDVQSKSIRIAKARQRRQPVGLSPE